VQARLNPLWIAIFGVAVACKSPPPGEDAPAPAPEAPAEAAPAAATVPLETRYAQWRARFEQDDALGHGDAFPQLRADLVEVANTAEDRHLRANAALLLGAVYEQRKEPAEAEGFYRLAAGLVTDDPGPKMALALVLAAQNEFAEAARVQAEVAVQDPDNLENWLLLGELRHKAGDAAGAAQAYVDYERRRKGLIDGLTLTRDGAPIVARDERIGCAEALAVATDQGTAVALAYALEKDPEPLVRAAVARIMGVQRLAWYRAPLEQRLARESEAEVREALTWALAEIAREPVEVTRPSAEEMMASLAEGTAAQAPEGAAAEGGNAAPKAEPAAPKAEPAAAEPEPAAPKAEPAAAEPTPEPAATPGVARPSSAPAATPSDTHAPDR